MSNHPPSLIDWRNAAAEAQSMLPRGNSPRRAYVLEPSPPAVRVPPYFADDPATPGSGCPGDHAGRLAPDGLVGTETVTPTSAGDVTWRELAGHSEELAHFARDRWLGPWRRLGPLPDDYLRCLVDAHRLAYAVVAEARRQSNGKFGLRYTVGGFGTPFFPRDGRDTQVRVVAGQIVVQSGEEVSVAAIDSLANAAAHCGVTPGTEAAEHDSPPLGDLQRALRVDADLTAFLGDWVGFAFSVLEELRLTPGARDVGRTQLWPGHFDPAVELTAGEPTDDPRGSQSGDPSPASDDGDISRRATYGASPGDQANPTPYLYVGPWGGIDDDPFWSAESFRGAALGYDRLLEAGDQRQAALEFFGAGYERLSRR
ncbi:MAG: hypothetical protein F4121_01300 [Acidimicrobiia bacterium]|nr:hypothetical protein [Acidimicrobiia bacterium]